MNSKNDQGIIERFLADAFGFDPTAGRWAGLHDYLGRMPDFSYERVMGFAKRLQFYGTEVARALKDSEEPRERGDLLLVQREIEMLRFGLVRRRWWASSPMAYAHHLDVSHYLLRKYAPVDVRLGHAMDHLRQIPHFLDQQKYNLGPALPAVELRTAVDIYRGYAEFFRDDVARSFSEERGGVRSRELEEAASGAASAVERMADYMEKILAPDASNHFAVGRFTFLDMLRCGEAVELELDQLVKSGEADLNRNLNRLKELASNHWPHRPLSQVVRDISRNRTPENELVTAAREMVELSRAFILEKDLVSLPGDSGIQVAVTPRYLRWAFALCDTPGPCESAATEAFYYITLPDPKWTPKQKEEWLTKFDTATLDNISIHEAYPGHYLQSLHQRRAPSLPSRVVNSYSFVEGWAHYCEQMMIDSGWRAGRPEFVVAQLCEAILRNCRYLCAIRMHAQKMSVEEAARFFMENAFMEETPARKEAERGTFDPGYLNYTLGKLMILELREDWRRQEGSRYSLKRFHDTLLSLGAPPIPLARRQMLLEDDGSLLPD